MAFFLRSLFVLLMATASANAQRVDSEDMPPRVIDPATMAELLTPTEEDITYGSKDAPVVLVEYASLSCNHCAKFHNTVLPTLKDEFFETGKVFFVARDFPLNAPALRAGMVVRCAPEGKAKKFQEVLFKLQDKWAFTPDFLDAIKKITSVGGLSADAFDACIADKELENEMLEARKVASDNLPIDGTPAFFLNGKPLKIKPTIENFRKALNDAVAAAR